MRLMPVNSWRFLVGFLAVTFTVAPCIGQDSTEPAKTEPAKTAPAKTEPTKTEPTKTEPTKTEPTKTEPAKTEPAKTEPAKTEPAKTAPAKTAPVARQPAVRINRSTTKPAVTLESMQEVIDTNHKVLMRSLEPIQDEVSKLRNDVDGLLEREQSEDARASMLQQQIQTSRVLTQRSFDRIRMMPRLERPTVAGAPAFTRIGSGFAAANIGAAATNVFPTRASTPARRVHFLVFSLIDDLVRQDGSSGIGLGAQANHAFLISFAQKIQSGFPTEQQFRVNIIEGQPFTVADFANKLTSMTTDVTNQDTVFCYISTHGAFAEDGSGHFFEESGGGLIRRSDLLRPLAALGARQTILITDACATSTATGPAVQSLVVGAGLPTYALRDLLFNYAGSVPLNINGASVGEEGIYALSSSTNGGGIFTRAFMEKAVYGNSTLGWSGFFSDLVTQTQGETAFQRARNPAEAAKITDQTPALFDSNGQPIANP